MIPKSVLVARLILPGQRTILFAPWPVMLAMPGPLVEAILVAKN
jgi:hypothetical protein